MYVLRNIFIFIPIKILRVAFLSSNPHQLLSKILIKIYLDHHESLKSEIGNIRLHNDFIEGFANTEIRERVYYCHSDHQVPYFITF